jgi:hypothetical protein
MKQWVTPHGHHYTGDKLHSCDIEVTERPPLTKEQEAEVAKEELSRIDAQSIRATRAILLSLLEGQVPNKEDVDILRDRERAATERRSLI